MFKITLTISAISRVEGRQPDLFWLIVVRGCAKFKVPASRQLNWFEHQRGAEEVAALEDVELVQVFEQGSVAIVMVMMGGYVCGTRCLYVR